MSLQTAMAHLFAPSESDVQDAANTLVRFWDSIPSSDGTTIDALSIDDVKAASDAARLITVAGIYHPEFRHYVPDQTMLFRATSTEEQVLHGAALRSTVETGGFVSADKAAWVVGFTGGQLAPFGSVPPWANACNDVMPADACTIFTGEDAPRTQLFDAMTQSHDIASWTNTIGDLIVPFTTVITNDESPATRAAALKALSSAALPVEVGAALLPAIAKLKSQLEVAVLDPQSRSVLRALADNAEGRLHQAVALASMPGVAKTVTVTTAQGHQAVALPPVFEPVWSRWQTWLAVVGGLAVGGVIAAHRR